MSDSRGLNVGDYVYNSWGYDQTNVDFFKVVSMVGKTMVSIIPVASKVVKESTGAIYVVPTDEERDFDVCLKFKKPGEKWPDSWKKGDGPIKKKAKDGSVVLSSGNYWASKWDGNPKYETAAGWGH
jgi:hypothetical protein